jgi:subtilisin family serine protease
MASPQVANLAAKLLAVFPALTTVQLRGLIIDGCDEKVIAGNHRIRLMNEKRSFELARERFPATGTCPGAIHETPAPSPTG